MGVEEQLHRPLVEDQLSAMPLTVNEFRDDSPPVSAENADQQLPHPGMFPIENESRKDFPPVEEADQQRDAGVRLLDELVMPGKSPDAVSEKDYIPLNVEAIQEAVEDDQKVTGEPGCCPEESTAKVIGMAGETPKSGVEESIDPILVMDERVDSALQIQESIQKSTEESKDCDCKGENRSTVEGFGDSCSVDFMLEPPVLDETPLCNVNNKQELELQDSDPDNPLQEDSTSVEGLDEKPSINSGIETGNCETASRVDEDHKLTVTHTQDHHVVDMNGVHTREDLQETPVCLNAKEDNVEEHPPEIDEVALARLNAKEDNVVEHPPKIDEVEPACLAGVVLVDGETNADGDELKEPVGSGKCGEAVSAGEKEIRIRGETDEAAAEKGDIGEPEEEKLSKENEKLRDVLGKLIQEGEKQMRVISDLNGRIKDLERKLTKKNKLRMRRHKAAPASTHLKQRV